MYNTIKQFFLNHIVEDAGEAWKWFSMQAMVLGGILASAWMFVPDSLKQQAPEWLTTGAVVAIFACGVIGRLVAQPSSGKPSIESVQQDKNQEECNINS